MTKFGLIHVTELSYLDDTQGSDLYLPLDPTHWRICPASARVTGADRSASSVIAVVNLQGGNLTLVHEWLWLAFQNLIIFVLGLLLQ